MLSESSFYKQDISGLNVNDGIYTPLEKMMGKIKINEQLTESLLNSEDEVLKGLVSFAEKIHSPIYVVDGPKHHTTFRCCESFFKSFYAVAVSVHHYYDTEFMKIALAHELGHAVDFLKNFEGDYSNFCVASERPIFRQNLEKNAWEIASGILLDSGYKDWHYFVQKASHCLRTYASHGNLYEEEKNSEAFMKGVVASLGVRL